MTVHKKIWLTRLEALDQTTIVDAYYLSFEALRGLIEYTDLDISELYYTYLFVNGLNTEVQAYVEGFLPVTVLDAYCLAAIFDNGYSHTIRSKLAKVLTTVSIFNLIESPMIVNSEVTTCEEGNVSTIVSLNVASLPENASNDNKETPLTTPLEAKVDFTLFKLNASLLQRVIPKMRMAAVSQCVVVSIGISLVTALMEDVDTGRGLVDAHEAIRDNGGTTICLPTVNGIHAEYGVASMRMLSQGFQELLSIMEHFAESSISKRVGLALRYLYATRNFSWPSNSSSMIYSMGAMYSAFPGLAYTPPNVCGKSMVALMAILDKGEFSKNIFEEPSQGLAEYKGPSNFVLAPVIEILDVASISFSRLTAKDNGLLGVSECCLSMGSSIGSIHLLENCLWHIAWTIYKGLGCCSFKRTEHSSALLGSNSMKVLSSIGHKVVLISCFLIVGTNQFVHGILCFQGMPIVVHLGTSMSVPSVINCVVHWHTWFYTVAVVVPLAHLSIAFKLDFLLIQPLYSCVALVDTDFVFGFLAGVPKISSAVFYGQEQICWCSQESVAALKFFSVLSLCGPTLDCASALSIMDNSASISCGFMSILYLMANCGVQDHIAFVGKVEDGLPKLLWEIWYSGAIMPRNGYAAVLYVVAFGHIKLGSTDLFLTIVWLPDKGGSMRYISYCLWSLGNGMPKLRLLLLSFFWFYMKLTRYHLNQLERCNDIAKITPVIAGMYLFLSKTSTSYRGIHSTIPGPQATRAPSCNDEDL